MIINGSIPGDPTEVAKAMAGKTQQNAPESKVENIPTPQQEKIENKTEDEQPVEKKKATVKKGGRKSSKKAEAESSEVDIDNNSLFNED